MASNAAATEAIEIGRGTYGKVFTHQRGGQLVAHKVFFRASDWDDEFNISETIVAAADRLRGEGKAVQGAECLAAALESTMEEFLERRSLFFELALYDLQAMVDGNQDQRRCGALTTVEHVCKLVDDCLSGLSFLHEHARVLHNDIKPQNVLYFADGRTRLADFGMAKRIPVLPATAGGRLDDSRIGTINVQAPEIWIDDRSTDTKPDVFSLGVTLFTVFDGAPLVKLSNTMLAVYREWQAATGHYAAEPKRVFFSIMNGYFNDPANACRFCRLPCGYNLKSPGLMTADLADLLRTMVSLDPSKRPSASEALDRLRNGRSVADQQQQQQQVVAPPLAESTPAAAAAAVQNRMVHSTPTSLSSLSPPPSTLQSDAGGDQRLVCVSKLIVRQKISRERVLAAQTLVREAKHTVKQCMRAKTDANASNVDDADVAKLERRLQKQAGTSNLHRAAQRLLASVRIDRGKNNASLSTEETLLFAILQDDGFEVKPGGCNMNRYVFELLTKRGRNWWKKRSGPLRANLFA